MSIPAKAATRGDIMESVIIKGDLSKLDPGERATYYTRVCESIGLNPLTQPLSYLTLNGKLTLYAKRDCADQLRKINNISIEIVSQDRSDGLLTVHVRAKDGSGREDEDLGVVNFPDTLRGEARANAILKAVTKAKRRVTLSISGLGFLDETEIEDIPAAAKRPPKPAPNVMDVVVKSSDGTIDMETGEIISAPEEENPQALNQGSMPGDAPAVSESPQPPAAGATSLDEILEEYDRGLAFAAQSGTVELKAEWDIIPKKYKKELEQRKNEVHKPAAEKVDQERGI